MTERRINPELLVLARESRGTTQTVLARFLGVTQATLSKWESGLQSMSESQLAMLARVLDYPVEFFYQTDQLRWTGSGCVYHRKRKAVGAHEYRTLLARVNITRMNLSRLMQGIEIGADNKFFRLDIAENGSPAKIAEMVRTAWNLPPGPVTDLTTAIEAAGGIVIKCDFGTAKLDAFSQWPPEMPPMFFVNAATPPDRYRFTLAHEIGHITMHMVPTPNLESEADAFAAEFLMPKRDIISHLRRPFTLERFAQLKPYWRVSMSALIRRARDLGKISDSYYQTLMTRMSAAGYRTREPVPLDDEQPTVIRSIIAVHMGQHGYTLSDLHRIAMANESDFTTRFAASVLRHRPPAHLRSVK